MAVRSGTTTTLRVDRPDGTVAETVWHDLGHTTVTFSARDGTTIRRYDIALEPDGQVVVYRAIGPAAAEPMEPTSSSTVRNPYGATVEEHDYDGVVHVEYGFDDEGRFRTTSVEGTWGRQNLELRPDLGRSLAWSCLLHRGRSSWNAWGTLDHYQVMFVDGSSFRWELRDDKGRETTVDWDGRMVVVEDAAPPVVPNRHV